MTPKRKEGKRKFYGVGYAIPDCGAFKGRIIRVGYSTKYRDFVVHIEAKSVPPEEKRSRVKFALTPEACVVLMQGLTEMFKRHGDIKRVKRLLLKAKAMEASRD